MANVPGGYTRERLSDPVRQQVIIERSDADDLADLARRKKTTKGALVRTAIRRYLGRIERGPLLVLVAVLAATSCAEDTENAENVEDVTRALYATWNEAAYLFGEALLYDCVPVAAVVFEATEESSSRDYWFVVDSIRRVIAVRIVQNAYDFMATDSTAPPPPARWEAIVRRGINDSKTRQDSVRLLRAAQRFVRELEEAKCDDWPDERR